MAAESFAPGTGVLPGCSGDQEWTCHPHELPAPILSCISLPSLETCRHIPRLPFGLANRWHQKATGKQEEGEVRVFVPSALPCRLAAFYRAGVCTHFLKRVSE